MSALGSEALLLICACGMELFDVRASANRARSQAGKCCRGDERTSRSSDEQEMTATTTA